MHGDMLNLPFEDGSFDGVYLVQSLHHVAANLRITQQERDEARRKALSEAVRVLRRGPLAIVQRDPSQNAAIWFWKYFPTALETKLVIQPRVALLLKWLREFGLKSLEARPVDDPMIDGFYAAEAPLNPAFQRSFSEFSYLSASELSEGTRELRSAIDAGQVEREIEDCRHRFAKIGGTVFVLSGIK